MNFVKRDLILLAGSFLFFLGLSGFMDTIYAVAIAIAIFFALKTFTRSREKFLAKKIGEGYCAECGEQIIDKKCPNCDKSEKSENE